MVFGVPDLAFECLGFGCGICDIVAGSGYCVTGGGAAHAASMLTAQIA